MFTITLHRFKLWLDDVTDRLCEPLRGDVDPFDVGDAFGADSTEPQLAEVEEFHELVHPVRGFAADTVAAWAEFHLGAELQPWQRDIIDALPEARR